MIAKIFLYAMVMALIAAVPSCESILEDKSPHAGEAIMTRDIAFYDSNKYPEAYVPLHGEDMEGQFLVIHDEDEAHRLVPEALHSALPDLIDVDYTRQVLVIWLYNTINDNSHLQINFVERLSPDTFSIDVTYFTSKNKTLPMYTQYILLTVDAAEIPDNAIFRYHLHKEVRDWLPGDGYDSSRR